MTLKPITDRAEVALDFPERSFMGSYGHSSSYEVNADPEGVTLRLVRRSGPERTIGLHLHYLLLADVLGDLARELDGKHLPDETHRRVMLAAAEQLRTALEKREEG
jgi:hypothetical protein